MILYRYVCQNCGYIFEEYYRMKERNTPLAFPCRKCDDYSIRRVIESGGFSVPEGGCGNAANGYSSTHGDAENFKAKSRGEKPPYEGVDRIGDI